MKISNQRLLLILPLIFSVGCTVPAKKREESVDMASQVIVSSGDLAILSQIPAATSNMKITVDGVAYILGEPYHAASGQRCRSIAPATLLSSAHSERLVCQKETHWFFAENVFSEGK